ncbi:PRTRC system ParB family protein [Noviherbaspirillum sp. CPCC 100848]|uniref:PRTRC system ParB family protein n=1 Tax=Noviherbaspirillum album TaxID=3080276 RepID=A0ABU6JA75_9BURK|nr:PRTRC system ParB family protein [Noviherbaspirillum sp. CPCC 100848]MEC4720435.1 PRTRC system ParB family protein [Noviherbaspirillum sp. CPCC 100848]
MNQPTLALSLIVKGRNPRGHMDVAEMQELTSSIRVKGVLQPVLVRPLENGTFRLIAGGRRFQAAREAFGDDYQIPVHIREMTDAEEDELALIENVQRAQMSPTEEADAAARVLGSCGGDHDEAARRLGWSKTTLIKRLALTNCSDAVKQALNERKIQLGHAELLAATEKAKQDKAIEMIIKNGISVADLKQTLNQISKNMASAIFDKTDCTGCPHNSDNQAALFSEAVNTGACTNGTCYDQKTEAELEKRRDGLKDEFQKVEIVRPGDKYTIVKIRPDGDRGVGEEQAQACRGCAKFGAAVSAIPDAMGAVYKNHCFDVACHNVKVADRIKAEKAAQAPAPATTANASSKPASGTPATSTTQTTAKPTTSIQDSTRIKEYRVKVWRTATKKVLLAQPEQNHIVLLALAAAGEISCVSSSKVGEGVGKLANLTTTSFMGGFMNKALDAIAGLEQDKRDFLTLGATASAMESIVECRLIDIMKFLKIDLQNHWKLCTEFLDLLTKTEIEVLCEEIGLKKKLGDKFSKVMGQKKDEIIKSLLNVPGFTYEGVVPRSMRFDKA